MGNETERFINIYLDGRGEKENREGKKEQRRLWLEYEWRQSANTWDTVGETHLQGSTDAGKNKGPSVEKR